MIESILNKLSKVSERFKEIESLLNQPDITKDQENYVKISKEYADLSEVVGVYQDFLDTQSAIKEAALLTKDKDTELQRLAEVELKELKRHLVKLELSIKGLLLPKDPDESATRILCALEKEFAVKLAVIVSDTFGRPWREGQINVALGVAGIAPLLDYRGQSDSFGRELEATIIAIADELASAAELLTGKTTQMPVVVIKGFKYSSEGDNSQQIVRPPDKDLFR